MARGSIGRQVARAAASGGDSYKKQRSPRGFQLAIVLIVVIGMALVGYSRYEFQQGKSGTVITPTTTDTWTSALSYNFCGTVLPNLPTNPNLKTAGLNTQSDGLIHIHPRGKGETGNNATLGKFISEYKGLSLTATSVKYPGKPLEANGDKCGSKAGTLQVKIWNQTSDNKGHLFNGDASSLKLENGMMITIAFGPPSMTIAKPPTAVIENLLNAMSAAGKAALPTTTTVPSSSASVTTPVSSAPATSIVFPSTTASPAPTTPIAPATTSPG